MKGAELPASTAASSHQGTLTFELQLNSNTQLFKAKCEDVAFLPLYFHFSFKHHLCLPQNLPIELISKVYDNSFWSGQSVLIWVVTLYQLHYCSDYYNVHVNVASVVTHALLLKFLEHAVSVQSALAVQ